MQSDNNLVEERLLWDHKRLNTVNDPVFDGVVCAHNQFGVLPLANLINRPPRLGGKDRGGSVVVITYGLQTFAQ